MCICTIDFISVDNIYIFKYYVTKIQILLQYFILGELNMKKFFAAISAAAMLFGTVAGMTACGGGHEHVWDGGEVTSAATCTAEGVKTFKCTVDGCNESYTEKIGKTAHDFTGAWIEADGTSHVRSCANCTAVDSGSAEPHGFEEDVEKRVPATCDADGVRIFVCGGCGSEKTEYITERPDHNFTGEWVNVSGEGHARKCADCEEVDDESIVPHNFENQPLICDDADTHHRNCADCGAASESVTHVWGEEVVVIKETFYKDGKNEKECDCGAKAEVRIPALDRMNVSINDESWQFGTGAITNFDTCEYTFTQLTQKNDGGDGYTDGKDGAHSEIKADWFCNETFDTFIIITYTFEQDVNASIVASFTGVGNTQNDPEAAISDYSLRIGLKDGNALKDVTFKRGTGFTADPYVKDFKQGDTLVFIFKHETDGWDQGNYIITINKAQPTDNAE